jgi:hypothetical protein
VDLLEGLGVGGRGNDTRRSGRHHLGRCRQRAFRQPPLRASWTWTCFAPSETSGQLVRPIETSLATTLRRNSLPFEISRGSTFRLCREVTTCCTFAKVPQLGTARSWTWSRATAGYGDSGVFLPIRCWTSPHRILLVATLNFPRPQHLPLFKVHRQTEQLVPAINLHRKQTCQNPRRPTQRNHVLISRTKPNLCRISLEILLRFEISLERDAGYVHLPGGGLSRTPFLASQGC